MKKIKKSFSLISLVFTIVLIIFLINTNGTMPVSAATDSLTKVTNSEGLFKRSSLILQDEYEQGVHFHHNQNMLYKYDVMSINEYDNIKISLDCSSEIILLSNSITTYQYDTENREFVVNFSVTEDAINFDDFAISNIEEAEVTIDMAVHVNNTLVQQNQYHISIYITPYGSFTTPYDMKSVEWFYNEWLFEEGIIDVAEYKLREDNLFLATIQGTGFPISPMSSGKYANPTNVTVIYNASFNDNTVDVSGTVQWTDADGTGHPARKILVEVYVPGQFFSDVRLVSLETDNSGAFSATSLPNYGSEIRLKVHASTRDHLGVEPFGLFNDIYSFKTDFVNISNTYFARESGTNTADAFYVHQAAIVGHAYASAMGYSGQPTITFPRGATQYNPITDTIWLVAEDYCDFDVILHEYGHYIMDKLNIEDQSGSVHGFTDILTDRYHHKEKGVKMAWGEGWATYFAISSQLYQNVFALNISNAGDVFYHDTIDGHGIGLNIHTAVNFWENGRGEGNELAVARVLLNLVYTGTSTSPIISYKTLWNLCKNSKAKHLSDFIAQVYANTPKSQISAIGTILQSQNITPTLPTLQSDILNYNSSTLTWTVNSAFVSTTYLDSFTVVFMDLSYNIKYEILVSTNKSVDLTSHINTLISVLSSEFYWGIKVNQHASSVNTGPYYSVLQRMTGIVKHTSISSNDSYEFTKITNVAGNYDMPGTYNGKPVISIGDSAFANQTSLSILSIPSSIRKIGHGAFKNCSGLTTLDIPDSVIDIGYFAFQNCTSLKDVELSNNLAKVSLSTFMGCSELLKVTIPSSVTSIDFNAFAGCSKLSEVVISNGVINIGDDVFANCRSLQKIIIPDSVTEIGGRVFYNCTNLKQVVLPKRLKNIESFTFTNCINLTSIIIPDSVDYIGQGAFSYAGLLDIKIPTSVLEIGSYAFFRCEGLKKIIIPNNVNFIGIGSFGECFYLESISLPFVGCSINGTYEGKPRVNFGYIFGTDYAWEQGGIIPSFLKEVIITGGKTVASEAFINCSSIEKIVLPSSMTEIGFNAFRWCDNLKEITIPFVGNTLNGSKNTHFGYIFGSTTVQTQTQFIPNSLKQVNVIGGNQIASEAFKSCDNIEHINISNSVTSIGFSAFENCSKLVSMTIPFVGNMLNEDYETSNFGYIFGALKSSFQEDFVPATLIEVTILNGKTIDSSAFAGCSNLTSINLPNSILTIGYFAFEDCKNLVNVSFAENSKLRIIYDYAFFLCENLYEIIIPSTVEYIGEDAFHACYQLKNVEFGEASRLKSIGECAFISCTNLDKINIPSTTMEVRVFAFYGTMLWEKTETGSVVYAGDWVVGYKDDLYGEVVLNENTRGISESALSGTQIGNIVIPETTVIINLHAFLYTYLENVIFKGKTELDSGSFFEINHQFIVPYIYKEFYEKYENKFYNRISYYTNRYELQISDYNFEPQYFFYELEETHHIGDMFLETKRLRTGYIEKEYIVLSPRRTGAGIAYLEYKYTKAVQLIQVDLSLWSASEKLYTSDCTAVFQYKDSEGNWVTKLDLLNDITLPTDRKKPKNYIMIFDEPITEYRFYLTAPKTGSSNSGRVCIGKTNVYFV